MTRAFIAERLFQGRTLSSLDAHASRPGQYLGHEMRSERREAAKAGNPVERR